MQLPEGFDPANMPEMPEGMEIPSQWNGGKDGEAQRPEQNRFPGMQVPDGMEIPEGSAFPNMQVPEGFDPSNMPNMPADMPQGGGFGGGRPGGNWGQGGQTATEKNFTVTGLENYFYGVSKLTEQ